MKPEESLEKQKKNSDANAGVDTSTPELPHAPKLPTPQPPDEVEPDHPGSTGQTPEPHFPSPGHLDPPV